MTYFVSVKEEVDKEDGASDSTGGGSDDQTEKAPVSATDNIKLEPGEIKKELNSPSSVSPNTVSSA